MPHSRKKKCAKSSRPRAARAYWLPMPQSDADTIILQCRLALEVIRKGDASQTDAQCIAHAVLLTRLLSETGYGRLDPDIILEAEEDMLSMLEGGAQTGQWRIPEASLPALTAIVNEHDRQLREVRLADVIACNERLEKFIAEAVRAQQPDAA
ncbi:transcriptional regulator, fis family [Burkholderia sp. YI23]|nr:transcriptional regulator, fis family [Burkholderia sp. YI23]